MKLEFGDKLKPQRLEFGLLRWNNLFTWNLSFLDLSSIKPEAKEPDTKKNRGRRRSVDLKKSRGRGRRSGVSKKNKGRRSGWRKTNIRWTIWLKKNRHWVEKRKKNRWWEIKWWNSSLKNSSYKWIFFHIRCHHLQLKT